MRNSTHRSLNQRKTVKTLLATQFTRLVISVVGFSLSAGLIYIGLMIDQAIAISAGVLGFASSLVLVFMDLTIFIRSSNQILEMVEPIYAARVAQLQSSQMNVHPVRQLSGQRTAEPIAEDWSLDMAFIEPSASVEQKSKGRTATEAVPTSKRAPMQSAGPFLSKFGTIELRTYGMDDHESDLERLERISKTVSATGLRKSLLVSKVGSEFVDESSLGDYVDGNLSFHHLAFPEILPGFDLLAVDSPKTFRRPSTVKEAIQLAATNYDHTILIVREDDLKTYQDLLASDSKAVRAEATRL
jgi:hypothetical protein